MMNFFAKIFITATCSILLRVPLVSAQKLDAEEVPSPEEGICESVDLRNTPAALEYIRNCTIIVGYLQVVLMEGATEKIFDKYSFPKLREVTNFVLLYRVEGLQSLGQLFPNLTLIRGRQLFNNYALIIYELPQLLEIGLRSLTTIMRGSVRVERNPKLCYSQTVSWEKITGRSTGHFIEDNGPNICPGSDSCRGCDEHLCWSAWQCQKTPSPHCHPECLGGCSTLKGLCHRCKHLIEGNYCTTKCSEGKIEFPDANQCITKELCSKMFRGRGWIWDGKCIKNCPKGHEEVGEHSNRSCVLCQNCPVVCFGTEISTLAEAQMFRGCTIVNGSLHIRFSGEHSDDVMKEMEENLGDITEINGYLKVYRSITITSLSFFKNLTVIHGRELENSQYSLIVYEMNNLQSLFNTPNKKKLSLKNGTIFFHYNAKLCLSEIDELRKILKVNITTFGVSMESNGFMATCHSVVLETESQVLSKSNVTITWDRFTPNTTSQNIIGYQLFYLEEPEDAVATDYGRDSCFEHEWKSVLIPETSETVPKRLMYNLTDLTPSTRYAFYVETVNSEEEGGEIEVALKNGQSTIKYFKTEMDIPSMPFDVSTISTSDDTVTIYWSLDPEYKGTIIRYVVEHSIQYDELALIDMRNYCDNPLEFTPTEVRNRTKEMEDTRPPSKDGKNNCRCSNVSSDAGLWENYILKQTAINGYELHQVTGQSLLCKKQPTAPERISDILNSIKCGSLDYRLLRVDANETNGHQRPSRHVTEFKVPKEFVKEPTPRPVVQNVTMNNQFHVFSTEFWVDPNSNDSVHNYTLFGLRHHSKYVIFIAACMGKRDVECGPISMVVQRTATKAHADDIVNLSVDIVNNTSVDVMWDEPKEPNGAIVSFTVEYKRNEVANFKPVLKCVTRLQHASNNNKFSLHRLHPGQYSVRVRATSLDGNADYTDYRHFSLPVKGWGFNYPLFLGLGMACLVSLAATWYYYHKKNPTCSLDERPLVYNEYGARYTVRDHATGREGVELLEF